VTVLLVLPARATKALTAEEIMRKTVVKADGASNVNPRINYAYNKVAITEKLNGSGKVDERKEKLIRIKSGKGSLLQIKINGKLLPPDELRREQAQSQAEDERLNDSRVSRRTDNWERLLTTDLISRYQFTLEGQQTYNDRLVYVLKFKPASGNLPVSQSSDRVVNNLAGRIWVDAEDFEIAKAILSLQAEVTLWGGIIASLRKFDYQVERKRLEDGVWVNRISRGEFAGRKLLDRVAWRTQTECKDFEKLDVAQASNQP